MQKHAWTLLVDDDSGHAERLIRELHFHGLRLKHAHTAGEAALLLKHPVVEYKVVVVHVPDASQLSLEMLDRVQDASRQCNWYPRPFFLCISTRSLGAQFELKIERKGFRYVHEG